MPKSKIAASLKQRHLLFGSREFIIKDSQTLLIREKSLLRQHETLITLKTLQANPTYSSSFSIKWLFNSLLTLTLALLFIYWANHFALPALYVPGVVFAMTTLLFAYRFLLYTTRLTIFRHTSTNENYLFLWENQPDPQQFERFVRSLTYLIQANHKLDHTPIA